MSFVPKERGVASFRRSRSAGSPFNHSMRRLCSTPRVFRFASGATRPRLIESRFVYRKTPAFRATGRPSTFPFCSRSSRHAPSPGATPKRRSISCGSSARTSLIPCRKSGSATRPGRAGFVSRPSRVTSRLASPSARKTRSA
jgi:hypothetical protein